MGADILEMDESIEDNKGVVKWNSKYKKSQQVDGLVVTFNVP